MKDWYLDDLRYVGDEHLDPGYVAGYDTKAQFDPGEDIEILTAAGIGPHSTVVDLGAGTGTFAVALAPRVAEVIAVDPSPEMTGQILRRVDEASLDNVSVQRAGFLSYEHAGPPADAVFTRNSLHQLPDFWKVTALRRIAAILHPGGILRLRDLVFDFETNDVDAAVDAWLELAADDPAVGYTAPEFVEHLRGEFSTFTWLLEPMLQRSGFEIVDKDSTIGIYTAYTCRRRP